MVKKNKPSRNYRRQGTKSHIIRQCQTATRGAANRARKSVTGKRRRIFVVITDAWLDAYGARDKEFN